MNRLLSVLFIILSVLNVTNCSEDEATSSTTPTLVVMNTKYDIADTAGQSIGIVPAIDTSVKHVRYAAEMTPTQPVPSLIKDLPWKNRPLVPQSAHSKSATRAPTGISDSTTTYTFQAYNAEDTQISINATRQALGSKCYVFVENGEEGTHNWQEVANLFDQQVWVKNTEVFGEPTDVDSNQKVVILYFKMRKNDTTEVPSILGYFYSGDLITGTLPAGYDFSNGMEVFYMNLSYGDPLDSEMKRTLFHEFQHMINYGQRRALNDKPGMDLWLDEGLAESAEHYGLGTPGTSRINSMNQDESGVIRNGWPLLVWKNDDANYGLSYTFVQYCRLQTGKWDIMTELINHAYGDYRALETVVCGKVSGVETFQKLLESYHRARLLNGSGLDGFKDENSTFKFTLRAPTDDLTTMKLFPGGAIFIPTTSSALESFTPSGNGANISFYKHIP